MDRPLLSALESVALVAAEATSKVHKLWLSMEMFPGSGCGPAVRCDSLDGQIGKWQSKNEPEDVGSGQREREKHT